MKNYISKTITTSDMFSVSLRPVFASCYEIPPQFAVS